MGSMKIYFTASMHGKTQFGANYQAVVKALKDNGHTVYSDHIMKWSLEEMKTWGDKENLAYHRKVLEDIKKAECVFVETSYSSASVGYMIAFAVQMSKPVIIFYSGSAEPFLFRTLENTNEKLQVIRYNTLDELRNEIPAALAFASASMDTRFNFFVSPDQVDYLDWVAENRKISRSVYLRNLINAELEHADPEFWDELEKG